MKPPQQTVHGSRTEIGLLHEVVAVARLVTDQGLEHQNLLRGRNAGAFAAPHGYRGSILEADASAAKKTRYITKNVAASDPLPLRSEGTERPKGTP